MSDRVDLSVYHVEETYTGPRMQGMVMCVVICIVVCFVVCFVVCL